MIVTYSLKKHGNKYITKNFQVKEFRCLDGADKVLVDYNMVLGLQKVRDQIKRPILFNSAYRTENHNRRVGGVKYSTHTRGQAVDIPDMGLADKLRKVGLYVYPEAGWLHVDSRYIMPHTGTKPTLRKGSKGEWVLYLQNSLTRHGFKTINDGNYGRTTETTVKQFQKRHGLVPDGVVGPTTWNKIIK